MPAEAQAEDSLAAPGRPKSYGLVRHAARGGPLHLVRFSPPQEIEPPIAPLDRAADHHRHEHVPDALRRPAGIAAALIEIDGVAMRKTIPRCRGVPVELQRR